MPPDQGAADVGREPSDVKEHEAVERKRYRSQIVWKNVGYIVYFHLAAVYGLYLALTSAKLPTILFGWFCILNSF